MNISLCMIVKNEAAMLQQSLGQLSRYVDDLIVVDTGSTDGTKAIAQSFTAKVYDFVWCDDFSVARNFSLSKASHDWVLVVDADEVVLDFNEPNIRNLIASPDPVVGRIKLINILTDSLGEKRTSERITRLFNRQFFHYEGSIHEQIFPNDGQPYAAVPVAVTVEHRGYTQEVLERTGKVTRNIILLKQALLQQPDDTYLLYQLGKTYALGKDFKAAVVAFARALALPLNYALEYAADLVEAYGYALLNSGNYSQALCLESYGQYYAGSPDYLFLLGLVYMNNSRFSQAIEFFLRCVGNKPGKTAGINSWLPHYNIAVIYECLGHTTKAAYYYRKSRPYQGSELALARLAVAKN